MIAQSDSNWTDRRRLFAFGFCYLHKLCSMEQTLTHEWNMNDDEKIKTKKKKIKARNICAHMHIKLNIFHICPQFIHIIMCKPSAIWITYLPLRRALFACQTSKGAKSLGRCTFVSIIANSVANNFTFYRINLCRNYMWYALNAYDWNWLQSFCQTVDITVECLKFLNMIIKSTTNGLFDDGWHCMILLIFHINMTVEMELIENICWKSI